MGNSSGSAIASIPGASFDCSTALGSNPFNKSGLGSSSSNKLMSQLKTQIFGERSRLLDQKIQKIIIGIEPFGVKAAHSITNSFLVKAVRQEIPTYLGGGTFFYHLSCLIFLSWETIILEYGAYYGDEVGYKNYIHYVYYELEGGLRFSIMDKYDYLFKVNNDKKGALMLYN